jgi:arginyl-tRNA synthetase
MISASLPSGLQHLREAIGLCKGATSNRVIVEHGSPNMAKPFHAGHLRSLVIGGVLARLYAATGHNVLRLSYLGDTGRPVGLVLEGFRAFGSQEALKRDPLRHLYEVYVAASARLEAEAGEVGGQHGADAEVNTHDDADAVPPLGAANAMANAARATAARLAALQAKRASGAPLEADELLRLWDTIRGESLSQCERVAARLGVYFDRHDAESMYDTPGVLASSLVALQKAGRPPRAEANGALVADFADLSSAVFATGRGGSTYLSRDYAAALERWTKVCCWGSLVGRLCNGF